jgi:hypothetical protein
MPTTIDSAGIIFNDTSTITSANTFISKPASPSNGQVLSYNGSTWTGAALSASPATAKAWVNFTINSSNVIVENNSFNVVGISTPSLNRFTVTVNFNIEDDKPILMTGGFGGGLYPTYGSITSRSSNTVNFRVDTGAGGGGSYGTTLTEFNVVFF